MAGNVFKMILVCLGLSLMVACTQDGTPPNIKIGPIAVKPAWGSLPTPSMTATPEAVQQVLPTQAVSAPAIPTATGAPPTATQPSPPPAPALLPNIDLAHPQVNAVLNQITLVQHHHNLETGHDYFTCASRGQGLTGVQIDPDGPRFVGPNSMDFDLWGIVALFKINPDGTVFLVPQQTGGRFVDPEGIEHLSFNLAKTLALFTSGDAIWIGAHGEPGRIAECDPQFVTPTPTPDP